MKVALCISGQARSVKENFENIRKNLIVPNNADVFVHTWYDEKDVGLRFNGKDKEEKGFVNKAILKPDTKESIGAKYKPILMTVQNQVEFLPIEHRELRHDDEKNPYRNRWYIQPQFCLSMFFSIMECNNLKTSYELENNFIYDAVIRARFDLELNKEYSMTDFDQSYMNVNAHSHNEYSKQDVFAFSNSKNMNTYSDTFNRVDDLMSIYNVEFCPEILLGANLSLSNIETRPVGGSYKIVR